jgi:rare lipoprotein A
MKWTLTLTACLLASTFSTPTLARHLHEGAHGKARAHAGHALHMAAHQREFAGGAAGGSVGIASYYGGRERGGLTAAHRTLPFGTRVRVTNLSNGSSVTVRINDRGPFVHNRAIDLSVGAARAIGMTGAGLARVRWSVI